MRLFRMIITDNPFKGEIVFMDGVSTLIDVRAARGVANKAYNPKHVPTLLGPVVQDHIAVMITSPGVTMPIHKGWVKPFK